MSHNARVLCLDNDAQIIEEMRKINPEDAGIRHMLPKARYYLVKLYKVRRPIVHILKETFLSSGGEAVVSRDIITAKVDYSDLMLCGTRKHYQLVFRNLLEQGFGCDKIAAEIESAIRHFDYSGSLPDTANIADAKLKRFYDNLSKRTLIMGILNVTPDSFSDGGKYNNIDSAVKHAVQMTEDGADVIDIGGESARPGSEPVTIEEERNRIVPVIKEIAKAIDVPISIDTFKAEVARAAIENGAHIINDISAATFDLEMASVIAEFRCPAVLMHIKGKPKDMQLNPEYVDLMGEVSGFLRERIDALAEAGVDEKLLIIDPGVGFGKKAEHNLELLRRLKEFRSIGRPILVGTSRKTTIGKILGDLPPTERVEGTAATVAISIANGADIVRVHDVKEMARVAKVADAIERS